ncbi:PREDICTED: wall-associated receptor kinase-like 5 [Theobroma cacao]|uniref:Wall-associated receptor kinase-like 5 n=1 Tax=Theobroma cacao TaxID=3641 RepID=A0AB32WDW7_THECC|nr:PREDICTED: wall-associated receptor kinase-like 5 [Theobroma cacao]
MGVHSVYYSILLLWLIQTAASQEPGELGCQKKCGDVNISFPFGIEAGCFANTWFRVTCKETANGLKPFISRINLELLISTPTVVLINNPVTSVNCGNKDNNVAVAGVNLTDSPYSFPYSYNRFGSVGCGNLATIFRNQTYRIGGCLQPRCGDVSSTSSCHGSILENLKSYTATISEMYPDHKDSKRCRSSVFLFYWGMLDTDSALLLDGNVNISTTHVPAVLKWDTVKCNLGDTRCKELKAVSDQKSDCTVSCGEVDIAYPFGMDARCYMNEWFKVTCNETADGKKPFLSSIGLELLSSSFTLGSVQVNNPVTYIQCQDIHNNGVSVNLTGSPFFFSIDNYFVSVGCGSLATILHNQTHLIGGCLQSGCSNIVTSYGRCFTSIPQGLSSFVANMTEIYPSNGSNRSCGSAFLTDKISLIYSNRVDLSSKKNFSTTLRWGTPKVAPCKLNEGSEILCSQDEEYCWTNLGYAHLCVCRMTEHTNEDYYFTNICEEPSKCAFPEYNKYSKYKYCHMLCVNAPGKSCSPCPARYQYNHTEDVCKPKEYNYSSPTVLAKKTQAGAIIIGCSTSIGTLFVLLGTWSMYKVLKRRKSSKLKQKYFKRNGGLLLQQQLSSNEGNVDQIKLFTSKELEKATEYYNENRILGQGGQGIVYKGMLTDGSIVAIKKSKMVEDQKKLDERMVQQFINEVIILSQINHRNVVKLLGCCLETKVPLLVYEFVPNGTLSQLIHDKNEEFPLTRKMRLRIATEIANALSYLHCSASIPIYHRDIKSSNILLDDKYRAKLSDFGTSRSIAIEQTHLTTRVQGTFGYLDPEYFRSSQFTEKSDVYSFGVVLIELLTGQKPISSTQSEEARSLVALFLLSMNEKSLFDILDPQVMNDGSQEEIIAVAQLAKRCLNLKGRKRPTMKQVAMELERIRASGEANVIRQSDDEDSDIDDKIEPWDMASCSTRSVITNTSVTFPSDA